MNIIGAIESTDRSTPFITRQKWQHITLRAYGAPKLLPTDSMDGMIVYSDANGKENPRRGWEPTAEDLIAEDWGIIP